MAGSYSHITEDDGTLVSQERLIGMLETVGDVYEAIEEMYGMIWWLAEQLNEHMPSMFGPDNTPHIVDLARLNHEEGLSVANRKGT